MTPAQQAPAPAAESPLSLIDQFIQEKQHDPELDHWGRWLLAEYAAWVLERTGDGQR